MAAVGTYPTKRDAELPQMVLWAAGIPYEVESGAGGIPDGVRRLVEERDAPDARFVLAHRPGARSS